MTENTFQIPVKRIVEAREFYANKNDKALADCQREGYQALFMPEVIDARIDSPNDSRIWKTWFTTPSIRATGRTKQGNAVVVYAHVPNHFSNPANIAKAIEQGLVNHAGKIPREDFQRLLDLQDNKNVFVVDYETLRTSTSDVIPVKKALQHPQTIPFLGGKERAEKYLERHEQFYGKNIGVWHLDDLRDEQLARLLCVGGGDGGLGGYYLNDDGRFLGVRCAEGDAQK